MQLNTDFAAPVLVHAGELPWTDSPIAGVQRRMLDRIGGEVARATSIVRYAPASQFSPHVHTGGEEFLVLEGVFQDEHGDFPVGSYIRNPPETSHTPGSADGCVIFVKLWQFDPADRQPVQLQLADLEYLPDAERGDVTVAALFEDDRERVCAERWAPHSELVVRAPQGAELLLLGGSATLTAPAIASNTDRTLQTQSWLRLPIGGQAELVTGAEGALVWCKYDHLRFVAAPNLSGNS